jgi:chitosanase
MLTTTQTQTAKSIVNVFETDSVTGRYSMVTLLAGDSGHLTYGRSQTTLGSGNLNRLIRQYCEAPGARFAQPLQDYLPRLADTDLTLDNDGRFKNLLRAAGDDGVMRDTQDDFFHTQYWLPALSEAASTGITTPLGVAVVYDSIVHGSWGTVRDRTNARAGELDALGEQAWIRAYVTTRRDWLLHHRNRILHNTIYRMDAFLGLIDQGYWNLDLPLVVRNREISLATMHAVPPDCFDGPRPGSRSLAIASPMAKGLDVRLVQLGLGDLGFDLTADGWYGQTTTRLIARHQQNLGLPPTGVADEGLVMELVKDYV